MNGCAMQSITSSSQAIVVLTWNLIWILRQNFSAQLQEDLQPLLTASLPERSFLSAQPEHGAYAEHVMRSIQCCFAAHGALPDHFFQISRVRHHVSPFSSGCFPLSSFACHTPVCYLQGQVRLIEFCSGSTKLLALIVHRELCRSEFCRAEFCRALSDIAHLGKNQHEGQVIDSRPRSRLKNWMIGKSSCNKVLDMSSVAQKQNNKKMTFQRERLWRMIGKYYEKCTWQLVPWNRSRVQWFMACTDLKHLLVMTLTVEKQPWLETRRYADHEYIWNFQTQAYIWFRNWTQLDSVSLTSGQHASQSNDQEQR